MNQYINSAILEAKQASIKNVRPNPLVGAIILDEKNKIVGAGFHAEFGKDHAEVVAIKNAKKNGADLSNCTLVVSLEPCSHYGKTPPCTNLIIESGIKKVIVGSKDPNPVVRGIDLLKEHNIDVILIESQEALDLNKEFFTNQRYQRPFIIAKAAITRDEQMAKDDGSSKWISGEKSRAYTHEILRSGVNAILTTAKTVLTDDARFTIRTNDSVSELTTIVIDRNLELLKNKNLAIHYARKSSKLFLVAEKIPNHITLNPNTEIIESTFIDGKLEFESLLTQLYKNHSIYSLLIEAGPTFLNALLDKNWVDEFVLFKSPNSFHNRCDRFKLDLSKLAALKEEASWELDVDVVKTYSTQNWRVHKH